MNTVRIPVGYWITGFDNSGGGDPNGWKVYMLPMRLVISIEPFVNGYHEII